MADTLEPVRLFQPPSSERPQSSITICRAVLVDKIIDLIICNWLFMVSVVRAVYTYSNTFYLVSYVAPITHA